jgi:tetratricopeptide (TPR) repeat protein
VPALPHIAAAPLTLTRSFTFAATVAPANNGTAALVSLRRQMDVLELVRETAAETLAAFGHTSVASADNRSASARAAGRSRWDLTWQGAFGAVPLLMGKLKRHVASRDALGMDGAPEECAAAAEAAERRKHQEADLRKRASAAHKGAEYTRAFQLYTELIGLAEVPSAKSYLNRATVLIHLARYEDALADADRTVAIEPDCAKAHANRGSALQRLCRRRDGKYTWADARQAFVRSLEICPESPAVRLVLEEGDRRWGWAGRAADPPPELT